MKHKFSAVLLSLMMVCLVFTGSASARSSVRVGSAEEFQKALDDGVTDITITSSFSGNFVIPRWVYSISGTSQNITISPKDESKPVFDAESSTKKNLVRAAEILLWWPGAVIHGAVSNSTADSLSFSDLTIVCANKPGEATPAGIDTNSISKQVTVSNVKFKGIRTRTTTNDRFEGCAPSTKTTFTNCTFEDLTWGVYAVDSTAGYNIIIRNCTFKNTAQALAVNASSSSARASIENCKAEGLYYWVFQHGTGTSIMYVTVDQATIDSYSGSDFYHRAVETLSVGNAYNSPQFYTFSEDLSRSFKALNPETRKTLIRERSERGWFSETARSWDEIRIFAMNELTKKLRDVDLSDKNHKAIDECMSLYALLAYAPVSHLFSPEGNIVESKVFALCEDIIKDCVRDKNLTRPLIWAFFDSAELAPLTRTGARISWGSTGNVAQALASQKVDQTPDRVFRENLHRLQDWLTALDETRKNMQEIRRAAAGHYDYGYLSELDKQLRAVYDLGVAANRFSAAIFFDLPTGIAFASNFARVITESSKSRIMGICRELGPFYSVSQRLCVLNRTQTLRNELLKLWKRELTETHFFGADDTSKYDELVASLASDPDLMRDATRINDFFREWR